MTRSKVEALARQETDHRTLALETDHVVRPEIGYDMAAWSSVDPATMLVTSCTLTGDAEVDHERELRSFELEWEGTDPNTYVDIATRPSPAAALSEVGDLDAVRRYRELMAPLGIKDELRLVFRSRSGVWGALTAFRASDRPEFAPNEVVEAARLSELMAEGMRRCFLRAAVDRFDQIEDPPGQLVVDRSGTIVETTGAAESLLDTLGDPGRVPSVIRSLVARLATVPAPAATLVGSVGPVSLHAMEMKGSPNEIGIVVERPRPAVLTDLIMRAHGLTEREREVTQAVLLGQSTNQIASALGISTHTVQDHLKAIFAKVGVATRGELTAAIYTRHYLPQRREGAQPSPYGYFLG